MLVRLQVNEYKAEEIVHTETNEHIQGRAPAKDKTLHCTGITCLPKMVTPRPADQKESGYKHVVIRSLTPD